MAEKVEAGTVWINKHLALSTAAPFGGWKESGFGVELGKEGLKEWCRAKVMWLEK